MKAEYVNSFYQATTDVFQLMLDLQAERGTLKLLEDMVLSKDASVILGVTGDLRGTILFTFPKDMVLEMVKIMSGMEMAEIDSFVSSAIGEVANIIGGNAVTILANHDYTCDIATPQVLIGEYKSLSVGNEKALLLPLITSIGEFEIALFLKEKQ
ncbi:chemotaxis protein CheX [Desulforamulus aeronauticus]|uniref:Chemotaxis protein CheX n=1 Tax=Desulforamulus aeronauticus DSM 10349 TaxID=1121421 RepID=A0A1M6PYT7_9FIRM|nr:chemotaxis protein CheX [Desulforamulus aeronauticus]SHK13098.1 chemotaxis protein CheX [Desulforamulus aeronauticus DSM 10349]